MSSAAADEPLRVQSCVARTIALAQAQIAAPEQE